MNDSSDIRLVRGEPSAEELAAAIAVVQAAIATAEAEAAHAAKLNQTGKSAWARSRGMLRQGIKAGAKQWNASFKDGLR